MARGAILHVGCNKSHGFLGPVFGDGSFKFIPIPEVRQSKNSWTYHDLGLAEFLPRNWRWDKYAHNDPEFQTFTWGDYKNKRTFQARRLTTGDYYFFISSLMYHNNGGTRSDDVYLEWAYYLIGYFEVASSPIEVSYPLSGSVLEKFANNAHVRRRDEEGKPFLIFNGTRDGRSKRLERAVALSRKTAPNELARQAIPWLKPSREGWNKRWWEEGIISEEGVTLLLDASRI